MHSGSSIATASTVSRKALLFIWAYLVGYRRWQRANDLGTDAAMAVAVAVGVSHTMALVATGPSTLTYAFAGLGYGLIIGLGGGLIVGVAFGLVDIATIRRCPTATCRPGLQRTLWSPASGRRWRVPYPRGRADAAAGSDDVDDARAGLGRYGCRTFCCTASRVLRWSPNAIHVATQPYIQDDHRVGVVVDAVDDAVGAEMFGPRPQRARQDHDRPKSVQIRPRSGVAAWRLTRIAPLPAALPMPDRLTGPVV
jgi:hypothetical protein